MTNYKEWTDRGWKVTELHECEICGKLALPMRTWNEPAMVVVICDECDQKWQKQNDKQ